MKSYLKKIERKFDYTDKSQYDYVLNQSERSENFSSILFELFKKDLKQEDFAYYPNTKKFKEKICKFYNVETENLFLSDGSDVGISQSLKPSQLVAKLSHQNRPFQCIKCIVNCIDVNIMVYIMKKIIHYLWINY